MNPEEEVEIKIWDWLKTKSQYVKEVYFNRRNILNAPIFTTKGINKKPDLIIEFNRGFGQEYCAIEVKTAKSHRNVHDSGKILDYYKNYVDNKTQYFIDNKEITINHFIVATELSMRGKLFPGDNEIEPRNSNMTISSFNFRKYKIEPEVEYKLTAFYIRGLWSRFRDFRKEEREKKPSLGIMLCSFNDSLERYLFTAAYPIEDKIHEIYAPFIMIMNYNSHLLKPKWGARWWKI